jgi:hypothetical protein
MILGKGVYIDGFTYSVLKHLNGRADPSYVRDQILEIARRRVAEASTI